MGELLALTAWLRIASLSLPAHHSPPHPMGPLAVPHSLDSTFAHRGPRHECTYNEAGDSWWPWQANFSLKTQKSRW